ncbi:restriction endonuclease subunit S [Variovorax sp. RB2P76]|uniref:restriction endonuclease subunit S n=1 Tax=Variovorax sp. RB2P76 TaxID=3443736 RepID=UPI003F477F48
MEMREPSAQYPNCIKRTELGALPADWKAVSLGAFLPFVTSGSRGWATYYSDIGSTFLRITNLSRSRIYPSLKDLRYVAVPPDNSEGVRTALRVGDLLISITADIGIVGLVTEDIDLPAYINQHIALVRLSDRDVNSRYLAYFLAGASAQQRFKSMTDAGAKAGMSLSGVRDVLAALPPTTDEQRAIADALTDADALIDSLEQLLTKKRQIKQGAMQELLTGKRRLPGFHDKWPLRAMGDLFEFSGGLSASRDQLGHNGICYLHYGDIHLSNKTHIDLDAEQQELPRLDIDINEVGKSTLLRAGDVIFVDASEDDEGVSKHVVIHSSGDHNLISGLHTIVARPKSKELVDLYKRYCFQAPDVRAQFRFFAVGTKVSGVSKGNIGKITLGVPSSSEQIQIAECLCSMDTDIAALEARLTKARALKQAMAQALLTGRIRLLEPQT